MHPGQSDIMELHGIDYQFNLFSKWLYNWKSQKKKVCILFGRQGVGKTSSVYEASRQLGLNVIEFNSSNERSPEFFQHELKPILLSLGFFPEVVLLDEMEGVYKGAQSELVKYLDKIVKPLVITTNDISSISGKLRSRAFEVYYPIPNLQDLVNYARKKGLKGDFSKLKDARDYRQVEMIMEGSDGYESELTFKDKMLKMMASGDYGRLDPKHTSVLLDNSVHLQGIKLWEFVSGLKAYDLTGDTRFLEGLKLKIKN